MKQIRQKRTRPPQKSQDANVDTNGTASDGEEVSSGIQEDVYIQTFEVPEYEQTELLDEEGEVETTIQTIEAPVVSFMKSHDQELIEDQNLTLKSINRVKPTEGAITSCEYLKKNN